jgi:hypothetical protein
MSTLRSLVGYTTDNARNTEIREKLRSYNKAQNTTAYRKRLKGNVGERVKISGQR